MYVNMKRIANGLRLPWREIQNVLRNVIFTFKYMRVYMYSPYFQQTIFQFVLCENVNLLKLVTMKYFYIYFSKYFSFNTAPKYTVLHNFTKLH